MASHAVAMLNSGFDYYDPLKIQSSIEDQFTVEVTPVNAIQANTPFEFFVVGGEGEANYIDPAGCVFKFHVRVRADAADPVAADEVSCIQNLAHSMFQRIELYANDKLINDPNGLYPYRAYFADVLSRGTESQKQWMALQGWFNREDGADMENYRTTTDAKSAIQTARNGIMGKGETMILLMRPHLELFNSDKFIPPGIKLRIKFTPSPNNFILKKGAGTKVLSLEFVDAKFYCQFVKATHVQHLSVIEALRKVGPLRINMNRVMMKHMIIATGSTTANLDNIYFGPIPNRIIMAMVADSSLGGTVTSNPFNFTNFTLNYLALYVNGKLVPNPPYQPDWGKGDYKREYFGTLQALNKTFSEQPVPVTLTEFSAGYNIYVFDLTPDHNSQTSISDQGAGTVRVMLRFKTALTAATTVLLHAEYDAYIEIDQFKNVTGNF